MDGKHLMGYGLVVRLKRHKEHWMKRTDDKF